MGFRFRRRIKLLPGVTLNVSRSGVSTTVGVRGLHETFGHGKTTASVGLPGSGLNYTMTKTANSSPDSGNSSEGSRRLGRALVWLLVGVMVLAVVAALTT